MQTQTKTGIKTKLIFVIIAGIVLAAAGFIGTKQYILKPLVKMPDLVVTKISSTPAMLPNGGGWKIIVNYKNQGNQDIVNPFKVSLWGQTPEGKMYKIREKLVLKNVKIFPAGSSGTLSYTLIYPFETVALMAEADSTHTILEPNEENNLLWVGSPVSNQTTTNRTNLKLPDLYIVDGSFEPYSEGKILSSKFLGVSFRIKNLSSTDIFNVKVVISDQKGWGNYTVIPKILAGEEKNAIINLTPTDYHTTYNPHTFEAIIDPENKIVELNENNNRSAMLINIPGYLKNAIIQFKMPDTDFSGKIQSKNIYQLMNEPTGITPNKDSFQNDKPIHSLYYIDTWWKNARDKIQRTDRLVFKSDIFGLYDLDKVPHRANGENCNMLEPYFNLKTAENGIDLDDYETTMYIYYDDGAEREGKIGGFLSCAIQYQSSFSDIEFTTFSNKLSLSSFPDATTIEIPLHESGHILGLTDTYAPSGQVCKDPEGIPEPNKIPKFPQIKACLMCINKAISPNDPNPGIWGEQVNTADEWEICPFDVLQWP